jgi:hypothetical protein
MAGPESRVLAPAPGEPSIVERNRQLQRVRDQKRKLRDLANNNSAFDLKRSAAQVWLVGAGLEHLANNNSAPAQVWVLEALPPRRGPQTDSCQQQRSGIDSVSAG